jgi:hypothetical protein
MDLYQMQELIEYACSLNDSPPTALEGHEAESEELEAAADNEPTDQMSSVKSFLQDVLGQFVGKDVSPGDDPVQGTNQ